jgi:hypothetical protein
MKKLIPFVLVIALLFVASFSGLPSYIQQKWSSNPSVATLAKDTLTNVQDTTADFVQYHDVEFFPAKHDEAALQKARIRMDSADVPIDLSWATLKDVKFKRKYVKEHEQEFEFPVFGTKIKALNGKKVSIKGYIIPINKGLYALSKNPYAACFFCGGAGPETIMGIVFRDIPKQYKTDTFVTLKGVLKLNDTDFEQLMYQIMAAEAVK